MDVASAADFVRGNHHAVMATWTSSGSLRQSPVLVGVDDEGRFVVSSRETAYKTKHVRGNPRAQLCVLPDTFFGEWLYVEGDVEVVSLPDAMPLLEDYYRSVAGEHDDWDAYRSSMEEEQRVVLRLTGDHAGPEKMG